MIAQNDPSIAPKFHWLFARIKAQGVEQWTEPRNPQPDLEGLIYLCKFGFFTGLLTKAQIGRLLDIDRQERKQLVRAWYDDHRAKGCGTC